MGGVDLSESGDVHWEAPVWKNHSEHFEIFGERERERCFVQLRRKCSKGWGKLRGKKIESLEASRKVQMVVDRAGLTAGGSLSRDSHCVFNPSGCNSVG